MVRIWTGTPGSLTVATTQMPVDFHEKQKGLVEFKGIGILHAKKNWEKGATGQPGVLSGTHQAGDLDWWFGIGLEPLLARAPESMKTRETTTQLGRWETTPPQNHQSKPQIRGKLI